MEKRALLVIDMQNDFVLSGAPLAVEGAVRIIPKIAGLLEEFRKENLPVFSHN
jgi:nicotinamidase-related amidase